MKKSKLLQSFIFAMLTMFILITIVSASTIYVNAYVGSPEKIVVNGNAELSFKPDTANVCVGVETVNSIVATAQKENANIMEKVVETLLNNGIDKSDIKTTRYNIYERNDFKHGSEVSKSQVSNYICFKTKDIDNLQTLIEKLTESGANAFGGITFSLSDTSTAYAQALTNAINNAHQKAQVLAPNSNLNVSEILEEYSYCSPCYFNSYAKSNLESSSVMEGEVKVCATVKVVFNSAESNNNSNINVANSSENMPIKEKQEASEIITSKTNNVSNTLSQTKNTPKTSQQ